jgi:hypothetical protein
MFEDDPDWTKVNAWFDAMAACQAGQWIEGMVQHKAGKPELLRNLLERATPPQFIPSDVMAYVATCANNLPKGSRRLGRPPKASDPAKAGTAAFAEAQAVLTYQHAAALGKKAPLESAKRDRKPPAEFAADVAVKRHPKATAANLKRALTQARKAQKK